MGFEEVENSGSSKVCWPKSTSMSWDPGRIREHVLKFASWGRVLPLDIKDDKSAFSLVEDEVNEGIDMRVLLKFGLWEEIIVIAPLGPFRVLFANELLLVEVVWAVNLLDYHTSWKVDLHSFIKFIFYTLGVQASQASAHVSETLGHISEMFAG